MISVLSLCLIVIQTSCLTDVLIQFSYNMGNVFQCCLRLSQIFSRKYISDQTEDRSPLLSRENSNLGTLSPSRTSGDLLSSPVLDQDHLLFPDIILSSHHGNELDRDDSFLQLEVITAERRQKQIKGNEPKQSLEGCDEEQMQSTEISHQDFYCLDNKRLDNNEKEWPLLSSLQAWPSKQPNAGNSTSQTLIYTYGQEIERSSPCQATKGEIHDEQKDASYLVNETEEMELNLIQKSKNTSQMGQKSRPKSVLGNVTCLNQVTVETAEDSENIQVKESNHMEQFSLHIQYEQPEAQSSPNIAQQDSIDKTNETVILMTDCGEPSFDVKYNIERLPQIKQQEITQTGQLVLEQNLIQTDRYFSLIGNSADQTLKEQYISDPTKQRTMESGLHLDEQIMQDSERLEKNGIQSDQNSNKGSRTTERFTLFVIDKLFLATPGMHTQHFRVTVMHNYDDIIVISSSQIIY